ncbi:protein of unknown function [Methanoculleus bourgensis]|uniref:Uncharacterized protein n=1 Tax=Methanoculleus bourgensis TaxID=83986 RepID=A0A0X3BN65_9EURY|nr:protein of unknown function [Methanoculleus bourgensis]
MASVISILCYLHTLCDLLDRLVEDVDLAVGVGIDLRGALGREHLGSGIERRCSDHTRDGDACCVPGHDVVAVEDTGAAATVDRVAEEREPDSSTHDTAVVTAGEAGLVLKQVVEVQERRGDCLGEPSGTTVDHGGRHGSRSSVGVPEHGVLRVIELEVSALLAGGDNLVLDSTLDQALDDGTDGSGRPVLLDEVIDQIVRVQALVGVGEQLGTLKRSDGITHLKHSCLLEGGCECSAFHRVLVGHHHNVVDRDVPERVAKTLVVLGDVQDRSNERTLHIHCVWVGTPDRSLDHSRVERSDIELLDDRVGGCGCDRRDRGIVGRCGLQAGAGHLDKEQLAAAELADLGVVAFLDLDHLLDLTDDSILVADDVKIHLPPEDMALSYLSGLQGVLDASQVDCNRPLGEVDDLPGRRVDQRADLIERHTTLQQFACIIVQVNSILEFRHNFSSITLYVHTIWNCELNTKRSLNVTDGDWCTSLWDKKIVTFSSNISVAIYTYERIYKLR